MGDRRISILDRIREAFSDPDAPVTAGPAPGKEFAERRESGGGAEVLAAVVALAIHRERRAFGSRGPTFGTARAAGPDEWAMSGRLTQVHRAPRRDPWNR